MKFQPRIDSYVAGVVLFFTGENELTDILADSGIANSVGMWSVQLDAYPSTFKLRYVGNISPDEPYRVDADGYGIAVETVALWCEKLSSCLTKNAIKHEFTHFNSDGEEIYTYGELSLGDRVQT